MDRTKSIILAALLALIMCGCVSTGTAETPRTPDPAAGYVPWWVDVAE